jgi:hypothetical protein
MSTPTYTLIDSVTLGASAASVTFSSISATGKGDLVLVSNVIVANGYEAGVRFNSDSGNNYTMVNMRGTGSSTSSSAVQEATALSLEQPQQLIDGQALRRLLLFTSTKSMQQASRLAQPFTSTS